MLVFLNGKFVREERAVVSVFDRGFLYGDGLFEGMLVTRGKIFRWREHMERLQRGVEFLKLTVPFSYDQLFASATKLIARNQMPECILRLSISRGITGRGYSPKNARQPAVVMTLHPVPGFDKKNPPRWRLITSSFRLPANDPLTRFKTTNKLPQVLARAEADAANANEAILLNTDGYVAEGTTSNIFWIKNNCVCTTPLPSGALPGVTRALVLELCKKQNIRTREIFARQKTLLAAAGVFLTMTSMGIVEAEKLDGKKLRRSHLVKRLQQAYRGILDAV